jgi:hypothetical protein
VVLAFGHALRAHEALGRPDALPGFLEVVHRLFENGVFVGHDRTTRTGGILRSPDYFTFSREFPTSAERSRAVSWLRPSGLVVPSTAA